MKKFIIYPVIAVLTAVSVLYRKVILETAASLYNQKIKPLKKKVPKQRKKSMPEKKAIAVKKSTKTAKKATSQTKPLEIKLVKKNTPKTQRQKTKKVVSIK